MVQEQAQKQKKMFRGVVVSDSMDKTVVVECSRAYKHAHTAKVMRIGKKYKVHDEQEQAKTGDLVEFYEGRPVSKTKYMYLARIITQ